MKAKIEHVENGINSAQTNSKQKTWEIRVVMKFRGLIVAHDGSHASKKYFALCAWPDYFRVNEKTKLFSSLKAADKFAAKNELTISPREQTPEIKFFGDKNETVAVTGKGIFLVQSKDIDGYEKLEEIPEGMEQLGVELTYDIEIPEEIQ